MASLTDTSPRDFACLDPAPLGVSVSDSAATTIFDRSIHSACLSPDCHGVPWKSEKYFSRAFIDVSRLSMMDFRRFSLSDGIRSTVSAYKGLSVHSRCYYFGKRLSISSLSIALYL